MEYKTFPYEIKEIDEKGTFEGYASIFGNPDAINDIVEPGAFTKSLKENEFFTMCWYHDARDPIGIVYLEEDAKGLKTKGELNLEVQSAKEKHALMKQKAIRGLSFGFNSIKELWEGKFRRLKEVKLFEVSPVTFPMHPKALISSVKNMQLDSIEDVLAYLDATITKLEEFKSNKRMIEANLELIDKAQKALTAILKKSEPPEGTRIGEIGILSPIIEALEAKDKPRTHLSGIIEALEN